MPYLFLLYIVAFLDRVNVAYAALRMPGELGLSPEVLGRGLGIFFIGYVVLEIPSTLMVEKWSARRWMSRIMISWGVVACATAFVRSAHQFYLARFLLGAAESGFFPGIIVYLNHWFTDHDKAKAVALFMTAIPVSNLIGAPLSGAILGVHWLHWSGWRWVFLLEGLPAVLLGIANLWVLTDWPREARWLSRTEQQTLQTAIDEERRKVERVPPWQVFRHSAVLLLTSVYFLTVCSGYGFLLWLPTLIKNASGYSDFRVSLLSALPYACMLGAMLLLGWSSDRTGDRKWHAVIALGIGAAGVFLAGTRHGVIATVVGLSLGAAAISFNVTFWALPARYLSGAAAAVAVGWISSIGNIGGYIGPALMGELRSSTGTYARGLELMAAAFALAAVLVAVLPRARTSSTL